MPVAAVLALAACSSGSHPAITTPAVTTSAGASSSASATPSSASATPSSASAQPSGQASATGQATAQPQPQPHPQPSVVVPTTTAGCSAGRLTLAQTGGQGAAGTMIRTYALRNNGAGTCTLYGFPGASLVDAQGRQLGPAASRQGPAGSAVRLAPGRAASFQVSLAYAGCDAGVPRSRSLRIYPPGDRASLLTPFELPVCRTPTVTAVRLAG